MPRYILIDNHTGYVFGDTADLDLKGRSSDDITPLLAARLLDQSIGEHDRQYAEAGPGASVAANTTAYHVYRADIEGSEAVPVVMDGQDRDVIDAVEKSCEKVAIIICTPRSVMAA